MAVTTVHFKAVGAADSRAAEMEMAMTIGFMGG